MSINPRVSALTKSATLKITALTKKLIKEGKDVVNFAAGEPDFDTPDFIKEKANKAIAEGYTKYTPSVGLPELREAIANKLRAENKLDISAANVIVTTGAKYAIYVALFTLLDTDDEVLIVSPYWVSYPEMVKLCGAKTKVLVTTAENNFKIQPEDLKKCISHKTKVLILNYPANPTGATYSRQELEEIYNIVNGKDIFVISDEIYEALIYDGRPHVSFASIKKAKDFTVTINGFSKTFSMTGWRIGYLAANDQKIIDSAARIIDHTTSCVSAISQKAALAALANPDWQKATRATFESRRDLLYAGLSSIEKLKPIKAEGTFYMFCDIRGSGLASSDFAARLLETESVSCIPADSFGIEGFVRFSFATNEGQIRKGIDRIKNFLKKI